MRVRQFYNKNQFVITGDNKVVFQSYNSTCAVINEDGDLILGYDWDYSKTTMKHLYLFLEEYWYNLNNDTREDLKDLKYSNNKKQYIQKLIDKKILKMQNM